MAATTSLQAAKATELQELRGAIYEIDGLALRKCSSIMSIARLTQISLESPTGHRDMAAIADALEAIWDWAEDLKTFIGTQAGRFDCVYDEDDERDRRRKAAIAHRKSLKEIVNA